MMIVCCGWNNRKPISLLEKKHDYHISYTMQNDPSFFLQSDRPEQAAFLDEDGDKINVRRLRKDRLTESTFSGQQQQQQLTVNDYNDHKKKTTISISISYRPTLLCKQSIIYNDCWSVRQ